MMLREELGDVNHRKDCVIEAFETRGPTQVFAYYSTYFSEQSRQQGPCIASFRQSFVTAWTAGPTLWPAL
jgi:hypothetical protein